MKRELILASMLTLTIAGQAQTKQLSLNDALELASKGNRTLQISAIENRKFEDVVKENKSFLQPTVGFTANYMLYAERPVIFLREASQTKKVKDVEIGGTYAFGAAVTGSYPIIQPVLNDKVKLSEIGAKIQRHKTEGLALNVLLEVGQTYLTIQFYKEQIQLFNQSLQRNEHALTDSKLLLLQGKGIKTDTLRNYIEVQNLKASISALENQIAIQSVRLKQLIGMNEEVTISLNEPLLQEISEQVLLSEDTLEAIAANTRPDVKANALQMAYSGLALKMVNAEFKPSLHAFAQYQLQSQADKFNIWNYRVPRTSFVGLQLNVPIYSGKRVRFKSSQANYSIEQDQIASDELKQNISREIKTLVSSYKEALMEKEIRLKSQEAAQSNFVMVNDRYKNGLSNRLELTDAELSLTQAKLAHLHSVYVIRLTELQVKKAVGTLQLQ